MKFEYFLAIRFCFSKKTKFFSSRVMFITFLTVILSTMLPVIILSILNGFHKDLEGKLFASNFQFRLQGKYDNLFDYEQIIAFLKQHPFVKKTTAFFESYALIRSKGDSQVFPVIVKAFDNSFLSFDKDFNNYFKILNKNDYIADFALVDSKPTLEIITNDFSLILDDRLSVDRDIIINIDGLNRNFSDAGIFRINNFDDVIVGDSLLQWLYSYVGDQVELFIPFGDFGDLYLTNFETFRISDVYSAGFAEYNKKLIFINFRALDKVFDLQNAFPSDIGVNLYSLDYYNVFRKDVISAFPDIVIYNFFEESIFGDFATEKNLMFFLMLFLFFSAFVTIYISINVFVMDKSREIAVLKAIGVFGFSIRMTFVLQAFIISLFAAFLGILIGVLITVFINDILWFFEFIVNGFLYFTLWFLNLYFDLDNLFGYAPYEIPFEIMNSEVFYFNKFPYYIDFFDIMFIFFAVVLLSILASYFPARKSVLDKNLDLLDV